MITKYKIFESLSDNERYLSDEEIEAGYNNYKITEFSISDRSNRSNDGTQSGWITIEFPPDEDDEDPGVEEKTDNWIKYGFSGRIAFDHWYPDNLSRKLIEYIETGILIKKQNPDKDGKELMEMIEDQILTNKFNI